MKIQQTIDVDVTLKAVLREGKVVLTASASSPYANGKRKATVSINTGFSKGTIKKLEEAMTDAFEDVSNALLVQLEAGRSEAITAASRKGEL